MSLAAELETVRKDRDDLNREFHVLGSENARMTNEHKRTVSELEQKLETLHTLLAAHRALLEENQIHIPERSRLPAGRYSPGDPQSREQGRQSLTESLTENETGQGAGHSENVIALPPRYADNSE